MNDHRYPALLTRIEILTETVRNFHFEFREKPRFDFVPGQFVMVEVPKEGKFVKKPYSIASAPYLPNQLELCIKKVEGGFVSSWFFELKTGDTLEFIGPKGSFRLKEPLPEHLIFVATGTGIAPLRAQFEQLLHEGYDKKISLIFGNRYEDEILFEQEFRQLANKHPNFEFLPVISRPKQWRGEQGYVQDMLKKYYPNPQGRAVYICGLVPMVNDLRDCLEKLNYPKESVHFEKWT